MKRTEKHARRRIVCVAAPTIALGGAMYVPNALPLNGLGAGGVVLMVLAALAAVLDAANTEDGGA